MSTTTSTSAISMLMGSFLSNTWNRIRNRIRATTLCWWFIELTFGRVYGGLCKFHHNASEATYELAQKLVWLGDWTATGCGTAETRPAVYRADDGTYEPLVWVYTANSTYAVAYDEDSPSDRLTAIVCANKMERDFYKYLNRDFELNTSIFWMFTSSFRRLLNFIRYRIRTTNLCWAIAELMNGQEYGAPRAFHLYSNFKPSNFYCDPSVQTYDQQRRLVWNGHWTVSRCGKRETRAAVYRMDNGLCQSVVWVKSANGSYTINDIEVPVSGRFASIARACKMEQQYHLYLP